MKKHETSSRLTAFLYSLLRDHVHPGDLEKLVQEDEIHDGPWTLTNGFLAEYAEELADRLTQGAPS